MAKQRLVLNNPSQPLARNIPAPKLTKTTSAPIGHRAIPRSQLTYANPAAQQSSSTLIPDHHLGHFSVPSPDIVRDGETLAEGMLYFTARPSYLISGVWERTSIAGENMYSYLSPSSYAPHPSIGKSAPVGVGTVAIYLGTQRVTEWDGKGWARYIRPVFLVDGVQVIAVGENLFRTL